MNRRALRGAGVAAFILASGFGTRAARAQAVPTGAPPPEAKTLVEAPKEGAAPPKIPRPIDGTTIAISAGGLLTTGNSRLLALSGNGSYETRFDNNGIGLSVVGNFGQGAPAGRSVEVTAENIQGRARYERFFVDEFALFLINTARHDRFQGLDQRLTGVEPQRVVQEILS